MATAALGVSASRMSVGRVFERAFATIRQNPLITIALAVLFGGLPTMVFDYFISQIPAEAFYMTIGDSFALPGDVPLALIKWFSGLVIGVICLGAMTRPVVAFSYGGKAGFGECLLATLKSLPQLIFLGVILGLSVVVGATFLLIPSLIIYILWIVAGAALVEEGDGVFLSLSRSQELSEGARWKCLAVLLLVGVIMLLLSGLAALGVWFGMGLDLTASDLSPASAAWMAVLITVSNLTWATVQASLYVELRDWKEGPGIDNLEGVFA